MDIIIAGSGRVGLTLARQLAAEGHDLTIIDEDFSVLESSMERLDVGAVEDVLQRKNHVWKVRLTIKRLLKGCIFTKNSVYYNVL